MCDHILLKVTSEKLLSRTCTKVCKGFKGLFKKQSALVDLVNMYYYNRDLEYEYRYKMLLLFHNVSFYNNTLRHYTENTPFP